MTTPTKILARALALLGPLAGCAAHSSSPGPASPATATATSGLRAPDAILADAVAATGGLAGWTTHRTMHVKLTVGLKDMAMGGPAEHFQTNTNKSLTVTTLPGVGLVQEGSNGTTFWAKDPINGLRFLDGAEAEQARVESSWNADIQAHQLFVRIDTAADAPAGQECLTMTPRLGTPIRSCYDRQTHLQVSQEGTRVTAQGDVPFKSTETDWRDVGGVKMAFSSETQAGPITVVATINQVTFDEPMDDKMFEPPSPPPGAPPTAAH